MIDGGGRKRLDVLNATSPIKMAAPKKASELTSQIKPFLQDAPSVDKRDRERVEQSA